MLSATTEDDDHVRRLDHSTRGLARHLSGVSDTWFSETVLKLLRFVAAITTAAMPDRRYLHSSRFMSALDDSTAYAYTYRLLLQNAG